MFQPESVPWATISAIGAGFLVSSLMQFVVGLTFDVLQAFRVTTPVTLGWMPALLGTAAAVAVALRAGGTLSLGLYLVYVAVDIALQIPGVVTFCERSGFGILLAYENCTPWGFFASHWAQWSGIGLGLLFSRTIAAQGDGANHTLRVAGAYALAWSVVVHAWAVLVTQSGDAASTLNASLVISGLIVAAAVVAGVVAGLSDQRVRSAAIVAMFLMLPWLAQLPFLFAQLRSAPVELFPSMLIGTFGTPIAAMVLVLAAAVADRKRFIPRDPA